MTDQTKFRTGAGVAGNPQQLTTVSAPPKSDSTNGTRHYNRIVAADPRPPVTFPDHLSIDDFTKVESTAIQAMMRALEATGAEWITETQWRTWAAAESEAYQVRGFRIPELLNKGSLDETTALFHAPKYGAPAAPLPLYRISRPVAPAK